MKIKQLSVFLENRSGRLARVMNTLGENQINVRAASLADTSDFGILRLVVNNLDTALAILKQHGFTVRVSEVVAVEIPDTPGSLGKTLDTLDEAGLDVEYMYGFVQNRAEYATIILRFEDPDQAIAVLKEAGVRIIESSEVFLDG